jgi:hypothetical protein
MKWENNAFHQTGNYVAKSVAIILTLSNTHVAVIDPVQLHPRVTSTLIAEF